MKTCVPSDQVIHIWLFLLVHSVDMLLEIIETWPDLYFASAFLCCTLVRFGPPSYPMYALLVAV